MQLGGGASTGPEVTAAVGVSAGLSCIGAFIPCCFWEDCCCGGVTCSKWDLDAVRIAPVVFVHFGASGLTCRVG